jgi:hypothetical protein
MAAPQPAKKAAPPTATVGSRVLVSLMANDQQTADALDPSDRGAWPMSPRQFVVGHFFRVGGEYFRIQAVIHDPNDPAGITLLVSVLKGGLE